MSVVLSICAECKLLQSQKIGDREYTRHNYCPAFPEGIPLDHMFRGDDDITKECNNGVRFVAKEVYKSRWP